MTNAGERDTTHVAQVYAQLEGEAARELVAFARVPVGAGSVASAQLVVRPEDLARWDAEAERRLPVPGKHRLFVGVDSADDRVSLSLVIPVAS